MNENKELKGLQFTAGQAAQKTTRRCPNVDITFTAGQAAQKMRWVAKFHQIMFTAGQAAQKYI